MSAGSSTKTSCSTLRPSTNKSLKTREEQAENLRKLEEECKDLERERETYNETWLVRQTQFNKIVEEGMQLRRLIRDEKEEVERREGMEGGEEDGEVGEGSRGGQTPKHSYSGDATPRPDESPNTGLKPRPIPSGSLSRSGSRSNSRAPSLAPSERRMEEDSVMAESSLKVAESDIAADTPMAEVLETPAEAETPRVTLNEPAEDIPLITEAQVEDKMDTT
jgi:hypothetical protein